MIETYASFIRNPDSTVDVFAETRDDSTAHGAEPDRIFGMRIHKQ